MKIAAIAAADENNVIGKDNDLPWHLPEDLKHFKKTTLGCPIIMGRKTLESFGKPLPKRINIIVTHNKDYAVENTKVTHSIDEAIDLAKSEGTETVFIIGGEEIFRQSMDMLDTIHLTRVHAKVEGDTYFPKIEDSEWELVEERKHEKDDRHAFAFSICRYERIK